MGIKLQSPESSMRGHGRQEGEGQRKPLAEEIGAVDRAVQSLAFLAEPGSLRAPLLSFPICPRWQWGHGEA